MAAKTKWSEDKFLDELRKHGDKRADECVEHLAQSGDYLGLFRTMDRNGGVLPEGAPQPLVDFFEECHTVAAVETDLKRFPDGVDHDRLARGKQVFLENAMVSCLVLLAKALPEGYAAPCLSQILSLSGDLKHHPYRRLLGVLQMVVNVLSPKSFELHGKSIVTARQVRLMHAGIRRYARDHWAGHAAYTARFGPVVNLEDMLATIMGFSYLIVTGLEGLDLKLTDAQAEDYYYVWRVYAQLMGIHPPGERDCPDWVPASIAEAAEFYDAYARRHYTDAAHNPEGVQLGRENLNMLKFLVPPELKIFGLKEAPRYYMTHLIGPEGCARIGLNPVRGYPVTQWLLKYVLEGWVMLWNVVDEFSLGRNVHHVISAAFLRNLIVKADGGTVTFMIPNDLKAMRELAEPGG